MANLIDILFRASGSSQVTSETERTRSSLRGLNTEMRDLGRELGLTIGLGMLLREIGQFNAESMALARNEESAKNALTSVLGSAEEYTAAIDDAKTATRGMASEAKLAANINLMLGMGIAKNAQEAAQLSQAASVLERVFGNVGGTTEKFFMLLSGGSPMLLNNFGMTKEMVNAKKAEIEATQGLAGEEARMAAIRAIAIDKANQYSNTLSQSAVQTAQTQAATEDFQAAWGSLLNTIIATTGVATTAVNALKTLEGGAEAWATFSQRTQEGGDQLRTTQQSLIASTGSLTEYNDAVTRAIQEAGPLAQIFGIGRELYLTQQQYDALKAFLDAINNSAVQTSSDVGRFNVVVAASGTVTQSAIAPTTAFTDKLDTLARRTDIARESAKKLAAQGYKIDTSDIDEAIAKFQTLINVTKGWNPAEEMAGLQAANPYAGITQWTAADQAAWDERKSKEDRAAKEAEQERESAVKKAADSLRSVIESVMQPTLSEVYQPPPGFEQRIDEDARRLADVVKLGGKSPWAEALAQKYAGQGWWQPMADAIASGNRDAMEAAGNTLLTNPAMLTQMWDVPTIVQKVKDQLAAQNAREQIMQAVMAELSGQGIAVSAGEITAAMGGGGTAGLAGMLTGNLATDMPAAIGASGAGVALVMSVKEGVAKADKEMILLAQAFAASFNKSLPDAMKTSGAVFVEAVALAVMDKLDLKSPGGGGGGARP